jgi:hypothetical protein
MGRCAQQSLQGSVQVSGQLDVVGVTRAGQRPYDNQATGRQPGEPVAHQMAKTPLHQVAHHRTAHGFAYDETRTRRGSALPGRVRVRGTAAKVYDEKRTSGTAAFSYRDREVLAPPQPILGRQHVIDL